MGVVGLIGWRSRRSACVYWKKGFVEGEGDNAAAGLEGSVSRVVTDYKVFEQSQNFRHGCALYTPPRGHCQGCLRLCERALVGRTSVRAPITLSP